MTRMKNSDIRVIRVISRASFGRTQRNKFAVTWFPANIRKISAVQWVKLKAMKYLPTLLLLANVPLALAAPRAELPPAAGRPVDFVQDIKPLFEAACIKCHAKGKDKGGFSLETRESFLK